MNKEQAKEILWNRCQHTPETAEAIRVLSEERTQGDLISREALKKAITEHCRSETECLNHFWYDENIIALIDNAPTVSDRYDEGFRDGYAQCINDKEERKENNRLFRKGGAE